MTSFIYFLITVTISMSIGLYIGIRMTRWFFEKKYRVQLSILELVDEVGNKAQVEQAKRDLQK